MFLRSVAAIFVSGVGDAGEASYKPMTLCCDNMATIHIPLIEYIMRMLCYKSQVNP